MRPEGSPGAWTPTTWVLVLILATAAMRIALGGLVGLGMDESYMVSAGREFRLGYFDHPPASWWLAAAAAKLAGTEAWLAVRAPFIALFGISTWLMYRLGTALFAPRAGLWAAVALNLAPVLSVTTGSWVLPDGPLLAALLGAALCLTHALEADDANAQGWRWWLGAGACAGLAMFAKYNAALPIAGAILYLLTQPTHRRWLARPQPYAAALLALAVFAPVVAWNAKHGWASFAFQGGRAGALHPNPLGALKQLAGQATFLAPWVWLPLVACLFHAIRRGPSQWRGWLIVCLSLPGIVAFLLMAAVSARPVLFHWAAPAYALAFPLLGAAIADRLHAGSALTRRWLIGGAAFICVGVIGIIVIARDNPIRLTGLVPDAGAPLMDMQDWTPLRTELRRREASGMAIPVVAAASWHDAGKIDYALHGSMRVICLCRDGRQFALNNRPTTFAGQDLLLVLPEKHARHELDNLTPLFDRIEPLEPVTLVYAGRPAMRLELFLGHRLREWPAR